MIVESHPCRRLANLLSSKNTVQECALKNTARLWRLQARSNQTLSFEDKIKKRVDKIEKPDLNSLMLQIKRQKLRLESKLPQTESYLFAKSVLKTIFKPQLYNER